MMIVHFSRGIYFSESVSFFPTYFTTSVNFFPISYTHFYCSLHKIFPNFNLGWIVSLLKSREFARIYAPCILGVKSLELSAHKEQEKHKNLGIKRSLME